MDKRIPETVGHIILRCAPLVEVGKILGILIRELYRGSGNQYFRRWYGGYGTVLSNGKLPAPEFPGERQLLRLVSPRAGVRH